VGWYVYQQSQSGEAVALLVIADAAPFLLFCLHAGWIADRIADKLVAWRRCYLAQAAAFFALAFVLYVDSSAHWFIYLSIAVASTLQTIQGPLGQIAIRACFRNEEQVAMASTNSVINNTARFAGAWIGAAAYGQFGIQGVVTLNAVSFLLPFWMFRQLTPIVPITSPSAAPSSLLGGIRYIGRAPQLLRQFLLLFCTCLLGRPIVDQIPAIAGLSVGRSIQSAANLLAAVGIGSFVAALLLPGLSRRLSAERVSLGGGACMAVASLAIVLALSSPLALPAFGALGFAMVSHGAGMIAFMQQNVESAYLGRVFALFNLVLRSMVAAGALALGWAMDHGGLFSSLAVTAIVVACASAAAGLFNRKPGLLPATTPGTGLDRNA
jgi:DHA3 family macrolide efflux protein-like MFS transporter